MFHCLFKTMLSLALVFLFFSCGSAEPYVKPKDPVLNRLRETAMGAFNAGRMEQAAQCFRQALARARRADEAAEISTQAYNLAVVLMRQGKRREAESLLIEALAEAKRAGGDGCRISLALARLRFADGDKKGASKTASKLLEHKDHQVAIQAHLLMAEIALGDGREEAVERIIKALGLLLEGSPDQETEGECRLVEGALFILRGDYKSAASMFDAAASLFKEARDFSEMREALTKAADAYIKGGDHSDAALCLYRAARSWMGEGDNKQCILILKMALKEAGSCSNKKLVARIKALLAEAGMEKQDPGDNKRHVDMRE